MSNAALGETGWYVSWLVTRHVPPGQRRRVRIECDPFALLDRYAEGVGFEPTEARRTSTAFEAVPFVHSGILPGREASAGRRRTSAAARRTRAPSTPAVTGGSVVQATVGRHVVQAADGARLGVGRAEHEPAEAAVDHRTGTHHARLERDDERAVVEPPVPDDAGQRRAGRGSRRGRSGRRPPRARCVGRRSRRRRARTTAPIGTSPCSSAASHAIASAMSTRHRTGSVDRGAETSRLARRRWDSNPRRVAPHTLSKRADSAALAPLPGARPCTVR